MSQTLFGRIARVTVGPGGGQGRSWAGGFVDNGLRLAFEVKRDTKREPSKAEVTLYNLNATSRSWCRREGQRVVVEAGYKGTVQTLFVGNISDSSVRRDQADVLLSMEAGDGEEFFRQNMLSVCLPGGATFQQLLNELDAKLFDEGQLDGMSVRLTQEQLNSSATQGLSVDGFTRDVVDRLCRSMGAEWSIQNNVLEIVNAGQPAEGEGVIARELYTVEELKRNQTSGNGKAGYKIALPLDGAIQPGRLVQIAGVDGWWRATKVEHAGDTHDASRWHTSAELEEVAQ